MGHGTLVLSLNVSRSITKENGEKLKGWLVSGICLRFLQNQILKIILQFSYVKWFLTLIPEDLHQYAF